MKRKNRPTSQQPPAAGTAERLAAIVAAAEQAAVTVIDDAEKQARRHLEEAEAEAEQIVSERLGSLSELTDSLAAQAEAVRDQAERLLSSLEEAKRRIAAEGDLEGDDGGTPAGRARPSHLSAVAPVEEPAPEPVELKQDGVGRGTPAGARLLATQMAVSGSSRGEIEARLRNGFEIEDTDAILDAILGPEE